MIVHFILVLEHAVGRGKETFSSRTNLSTQLRGNNEMNEIYIHVGYRSDRQTD